MTDSPSKPESMNDDPRHRRDSAPARPNGAMTALFCAVAVVWVVLDQAAKVYFENAYALGEASVTDFGLFRFRLVHNTGMAWGLFGDSTFALGVLSCIVCAAILAAFLVWPRLAGHRLTGLETLGLSLVFAGGLGNALDRFLQGYVVDFIEFTFIDFPVFNIADIGVTCGFVIIVLGFILADRKASQSASGVEPLEDGEGEPRA